MGSTVVIRNAAIYAAGYSDGIYKSTDWGASWTRLKLPKSDDPSIQDIAVSESSIYAVGLDDYDATLWKSTDGGKSWETKVLGQSGEIERIIVQNYGIFAIGVDGDKTKVWKSTDGGATWKATVLDQPRRSVDRGVIAANGTTLYAQSAYDKAADNRVYTIWTSTDRGASWSRAKTQNELAVDAFAFSGSAIYAGGRRLPVSDSSVLPAPAVWEIMK